MGLALEMPTSLGLRTPHLLVRWYSTPNQHPPQPPNLGMWGVRSCREVVSALVPSFPCTSVPLEAPPSGLVQHSRVATIEDKRIRGFGFNSKDGEPSQVKLEHQNPRTPSGHIHHITVLTSTTLSSTTRALRVGPILLSGRICPGSSDGTTPPVGPSDGQVKTGQLAWR